MYSFKPFNNSEIINYIENNNIKGCIVECGVHEGQQEVLFINQLNNLNKKKDMNRLSFPRKIYMYDTFEGMIEPTQQDFTLEDTLLYHANREETFTY